MASESVTLEVNQRGLQALRLAMAEGLHALAEATVDAAGPGKPAKATAETAAQLDGRKVAGGGDVPRGRHGEMAAFAMFGFPSRFVEFGTASHVIGPTSRTMARGPEVFGHLVHHPGARARPFIAPAALSVMSKAEQVLARAIAARWRP